MKIFEAPFETTRGALDRTLLRLGYTAIYGENEFGFPFIEYRHEVSGASISLRAAPDAEALYDGDLLRAEHSIEWWGIADLKTFYRLLRETTLQEVQVA